MCEGTTALPVALGWAHGHLGVEGGGWQMKKERHQEVYGEEREAMDTKGMTKK